MLQVSNNPFMLIFGAFQILLSQIPDFDRLWFLSIVAAVMSFSYSSIGVGLAIGKNTGTSSYAMYHTCGFIDTYILPQTSQTFLLISLCSADSV